MENQSKLKGYNRTLKLNWGGGKKKEKKAGMHQWMLALKWWLRILDYMVQ